MAFGRFPGAVRLVPSSGGQVGHFLPRDDRRDDFVKSMMEDNRIS